MPSADDRRPSRVAEDRGPTRGNGREIGRRIGRRRTTGGLVAALLLLALPAAAAAGLQPADPANPSTANPSTSNPSTANPSTGTDTPWQVLDRHPGEGEQCLVCRKAVHGAEMIEVRYKGRTFHVAAGMWGDFEADPERYFHTLEARSALFDEDAMAIAPGNGWLYLGLYVLVGLLFGGLCAYLAVSRALPALPWFFAGLLANVLALALLATRRRGDPSGLPAGIPHGFAKVPTTRAPRACPACGADNHPAASRCARCGDALEPSVTAETAQISTA